MNAVDTNVLIYVKDPRHPDKQAIAAALIRNLTDGVLLWQVANEYLAASRKLVAVGYDLTQAFNDIRAFQKVWTTKLPNWNILDRAESLQTRFHLSYWDSMIIAACLVGGVTKLYSEDFTGYGNIDGLELENPFDPITKI